MTQYAIITDLNRCVECYACTVGCKVVNQVPAGKFRNRVLRVGPHPKPGGSGHFPEVELYYLPTGCQHCADAPCVSVCPTGASTKLPDGTVQIDRDMCIGCQLCMSACPYGVRYLDEQTNIVDKCSLCHDKIENGELPECVRQCGGRARYFGDWEQGLDSFVGPPLDGENPEPMASTTRPFTDEELYHLPDSGNGPSFAYILRNCAWTSTDAEAIRSAFNSDADTRKSI